MIEWNYDMSSAPAITDLLVSYPNGCECLPEAIMAYKKSDGTWWCPITDRPVPRGFGQPYAWAPWPQAAEVRREE